MISFEYVPMASVEEVRKAIQGCEGKHVQQCAYSTFMDTLTQICFTEQVIRGTIAWAGNRSWKATLRDELDNVDQGCTLPPTGWWCSREPGHDGPCAARPIG